MSIFEIAKKWNLDKKIIREMDLFNFTSFLAWTFLNFLAHCEIPRKYYCRKLIIPLQCIGWIIGMRSAIFIFLHCFLSQSHLSWTHHNHNFQWFPSIIFSSCKCILYTSANILSNLIGTHDYLNEFILQNLVFFLNRTH